MSKLDDWMPRMTKAQMWENHTHIFNRHDKTDEEKKAAATALHREYYAQFVDIAYIGSVVQHIGAQRLLTSKNKDGCFNDIPLAMWDRLPWPQDHRAHMKLCGDFPFTYPTCEAKEAALQWYEYEIEQHIAASQEFNRVISSNNATTEEDPTDPEPILAQCPMCDAETEPIGQLGDILHYRCRQCNMVYNYGDCNV